MRTTDNISLDLKKSNNISLKILIIFTIFSYLLISIGNNEIFSYLYEDLRSNVVMNINNTYRLIIGLFAILSYYALSFEIKNRYNEIKILTYLGLSRINLFCILFKSIVEKLFLAIVSGMPIAIFLSELIDLISISLLDLQLETHRLNIDLRAIGLTIIFLFLFVVISLMILVISSIRKFPDENRHFSIRTILQAIPILLFFIYGLDKSFLTDRIFYILAIIEIFILLAIYRFYSKSLSFTFEKAMFLDFIYRGKVLLVFIIFSISIALTNLFWASEELDSYKEDLDQRPHFSVFEDKKVIDEIRKSSYYSQVFADIYPVNIKNTSQIDDQNFIDKILSIDDFNKSFPVSEPKIMDYTSYKNVFANDALNLRDNTSIFLYFADMESESYKALDKYLSREDVYIKIAGTDVKVIGADRSDIIFANNLVLENNIFVIDDDLYDRLDGDSSPLAYNFIANDHYLEKYGKNPGLEKIRDDFFARGIKFESLVWLIKNNYMRILSRQFILTYLSLILIIIGGLFLGINLLSYLNDKDDEFKILDLLGSPNKDLLAIRQSFIKRLYILVFALSFINYALFTYTNGFINWNHITNNLSSNLLIKVLLIPIFAYIVLLITRKIIFNRGIGDE